MRNPHRLLSSVLALAAGCTFLNDPTKIEPGPDTTPPAAPTGLAALPGITQMTLTWDAVTDWDFDHYVVYFAVTTQSLMKAGETGATTFTVGSLDNTKLYDFMVLAVDRFGNVSNPSGLVTAQPDGVSPTVVASYNPGPQNPANLMTDVVFTFSEPMDTASVEANATVTASGGVTPTCVWSWYSGDTEAKCDLVLAGNPSTQFPFSTTYHVILGVGATDVAGNALGGTPVDAWFTTAGAPDLTPPSLASVTVSNYQSAAQGVGTGSPGAQGVFPESNVVFTFSEPMDTVATAGAVSVTGGAGYNGGTKSWNVAGTVLTFNPDVNYPADGRTVTISIGAGAQDVSGNDLPAFANRTFKIAYQGAVTLDSEAAIDGYGYATAGGGSIDIYAAGSGLFYGDSTANGQYKGFVSFSRSGLPVTLTRYTAATLSFYQYGCTGAPYDALDVLDHCFFNPFTGTFFCYYTDLLAVHVALGVSLDAGDFTTAALTSSVEIATSPAVGSYGASVLTAVEADRTSARSRSQWRLEFPVASNNDAVSDYCYAYTGDYGTAAYRPKLGLTYEYY